MYILLCDILANSGLCKFAINIVCRLLLAQNFKFKGKVKKMEEFDVVAKKKNIFPYVHPLHGRFYLL
jgi:hypothetical protein